MAACPRLKPLRLSKKICLETMSHQLTEVSRLIEKPKLLIHKRFSALTHGVSSSFLMQLAFMAPSKPYKRLLTRGPNTRSPQPLNPYLTPSLHLALQSERKTFKPKIPPP